MISNFQLIKLILNLNMLEEGKRHAGKIRRFSLYTPLGFTVAKVESMKCSVWIGSYGVFGKNFC